MLELTTNLLADIGGWAALKEARALVERGKVSDARREGAVIRARVQGAEKIHDAQLTLADRVSNVEVRCTCIESKRTGRVCAHVLAAGLAILQPPPNRPAPAGSIPVASPGKIPAGPKLKRWLIEDAPPGTPSLEITVLLPLQLREALGKDPVRVILEGRRGNETQPFDVVIRELATGFVVSEEDERLLAALEKFGGTVSGINAVPRARIGLLLRALADHPRVWLGKKERIEVKASGERPSLLFHTRTDGSLEIVIAKKPAAFPSAAVILSLSKDQFSPALSPTRSAPDNRRQRAEALPIPGWNFDGSQLTETPALPPGFISDTRLIPASQIPDFLSREFPVLEKTCDVAFAPGFAEFRMETERPAFTVKLEGALSGLTLELAARYGEKEFNLGSNAITDATYYPDARERNRFWRRDERAERRALVQVDLAGFKPVRGGGAMFSLATENQVAKFLANTLPRWRQVWTIQFGSRLDETMRQVDVAEPEFALRSGSGEDWLSLDLKLSVQGKPVPLDPAEIQRWLQTGQNHARTADKRILLVPTEAWGEMREVLADCAVEQEPGAMRVARTFAPFLTGALTAQGFHSARNDAAALPAPEVKTKLEEHLWTTLRPYQTQGVEWLASLAQQKLHGLLADDMGLGKTLQALAFAAWLKKTAGSDRPPLGTAAATSEREATGKPMLVVCPTSLVTNWLREAAKFTPQLRTLDLTGSDRAEKWAARGGHDLLVTSYAILRRDLELYRAETFALVILDEAQHIKNRGSQNAQSAKALRAEHRLILTGTPLENSVLDLWSLYDFLLPGYLGTASDFRERYETPLTRSPEPRTMERLRHKVRPFFLRRTKDEVLKDLPPKLDYPTLCELTDEQREVYRAVLAQGRRDVFDHSDKAGRKLGRDRMAVLTTLLRLRQVCCHLDLLPQAETKRAWKMPSAKMERTFELIDEAMDGGHRVLLFSQFVRVLHLLRDEAKRREIPFCYLDGQTVERQAEVDRFQADAGIPLFFISLKAGGTGLNLTGADTVIHFDPWWNPAVEEQATARAHRIGQARQVQAYKLIAAGTVEEKIQALQARKRELFEASLGGDEAFVEKLTEDDLEELLAE